VGSVAEIMADILEPGRGKVEIADVFTAYAEACEASGKRPIPANEFPAAIAELCFLALESLSFDYVNQGDSESILGICPPMTGSSTQTVVKMVRIFDNYARQHPEIQHQKFELTALAALKRFIHANEGSPLPLFFFVTAPALALRRR